MKQLLSCLIFLIGTTLLTSASHAGDFDIREYSLKAVFLERFTRFIDWPDRNPSENRLNPFIISVVGNRKFSALLREIYQTQKIQGKKVIIQDIDNSEGIKNSHILFISHIPEEALDEILTQVKDIPVLTISDSSGFAEQGVMINFFMSKKQKIRFEINELAIKESDLYISYKLLSVAKIVGRE